MKAYIQPSLKEYYIEAETPIMNTSAQKAEFQIDENDEANTTWSKESIWNDNDWGESEE